MASTQRLALDRLLETAETEAERSDIQKLIDAQTKLDERIQKQKDKTERERKAREKQRIEISGGVVVALGLDNPAIIELLREHVPEAKRYLFPEIWADAAPPVRVRKRSRGEQALDNLKATASATPDGQDVGNG